MTTPNEDLYDTIINLITGETEKTSPILHLIADGMSEHDEHHDEYVAMQYALLQMNGETFDRTGSKRTVKTDEDTGCTCTDERNMRDVSEVQGVTLLLCEDCNEPVMRHLLTVARQNTDKQTKLKDDAPINIATTHGITETTVRSTLSQTQETGETIIKVTLDKPSGALFASETLTLHLEA